MALPKLDLSILRGSYRTELGAHNSRLSCFRRYGQTTPNGILGSIRNQYINSFISKKTIYQLASVNCPDHDPYVVTLAGPDYSKSTELMVNSYPI